jgi:ferredoxin
MATLCINGHKVSFAEGQTLLEIAAANGFYIPHLCTRPGIPSARGSRPLERIYRGKTEFKSTTGKSFEGCGMCMVEVEGMPEPVLSCSTPPREGMSVSTESPKIQESRRERMVQVLGEHPHACLLCPEAAGCDRKLCSMNVPEEERCCWKFGLCELQKLTGFVGIRGGLQPCAPSAQVIDDNPLFTRDYSLCIGCLRCVTVCRSLAEKEALGFVYGEDMRILVGTRAPSLKESGCIFCLACVEICPTGAIKDKHEEVKISAIRKRVPPAVFPSREWFEFTLENLQEVPAGEGVYQLFDLRGELLLVAGTENLRASLLECRGKWEDKAAHFTFEMDSMFTSRERQIIQEYVKQHGRLPPGNDEMDDIF